MEAESLPAEIATYVLEEDPALARRLHMVFGDGSETIATVERRAVELLPEYRTISWELDPESFHFSYVSDSSKDILGHPSERWLQEPTFWAETIVHPDDRRDAIAFCALATAQGRNHDFRYRARAADGTTVFLLDVVQVSLGGPGVPARLRGLMLEVSGDGRLAPLTPSPTSSANY